MRQMTENSFYPRFGKDWFHMWIIDRSINNFIKATAEDITVSAVFWFFELLFLPHIPTVLDFSPFHWAAFRYSYQLIQDFYFFIGSPFPTAFIHIVSRACHRLTVFNLFWNRFKTLGFPTKNSNGFIVKLPNCVLKYFNKKFHGTPCRLLTESLKTTIIEAR